ADGERARARLSGETLAAPELIDLEVSSVLRHLTLAGKLSLPRAESALADLAALPMRRVPHRTVISRCWQLRANLTTYDAAYVATAEIFDLVLVTANIGLTRASKLRCKIEVLCASET